ncbi:PfkB family carbohydrate kinase, partial [Halarchaeum acidiphilum]|uniref:PfkB family carbohydrate kinase n=1 Tax=Halarchaeum acidiphilum TaxID=489138 RepID=UPI0005D27FCD
GRNGADGERGANGGRDGNGGRNGADGERGADGGRDANGGRDGNSKRDANGGRDAANGTDESGGWLVVDPGDVTVRDRDAVGPFLDALAGIDGRDVALSVNDDELAFLAAAVADDASANGGDMSVSDENTAGTDDDSPTNGDRASASDDVSAQLARVRERASLDLAVFHGARAAVARDGTGTTRCPNVAVEARRYTGGGDRFSAGLAYALAAEWALDDALTLANACASFYVSHAETAGPDRLAAWLATRAGDS